MNLRFRLMIVWAVPYFYLMSAALGMIACFFQLGDL